MPSASFIARHKIALVVAALALAGGGVWYAKTRGGAAAETRYVLAVVEKGSVVASVTGTGQVSTSNQVEVKPKASGDVIKVSVKQGQEVKAGDLLVQLDPRDAQKAVRDAEANLASAQLSLDKLQQPNDALSLLQAENAVASAQRSEAQAQSALEAARRNVTQSEDELAQLQASDASEVTAAYEDGYNAASDAFLDMPDHMKDLKDLRGTDASPDENVKAFQNILGENSPLIVIWLRDHDAALARYNDDFAYFKTVSRDAPDDIRYELITRTLGTETAVSQALQSAHAMLDAVVNTSYKQYNIARTVDAMLPLIGTDISEINGDIATTQKAKDALDAHRRDDPIAVKKAQDAVTAARESVDAKQDAVTAAQENVAEREEALAKLKAGADPLDLKSAQISLQQRRNALADAREKLADYSVRAPFDGIVADVAVKKGDPASTGAAVATVVTKQRMATVSLNEVDAAKIKAGQKATLTFDAVEGLTLTGEVAAIDTLGTVSQGVVSYDATIGFDSQDDRVKPGMSVSAAIITDMKTDVLVVPNAAIKSQGGATYVEVLEGAAANDPAALTTGVASATAPARKTVETGLANDEVTEIVGGLNEGNKVVVRTIAATTASATQTRSILPTGPGGNRGGAGARAGGGGAAGGAFFIAR
ncbi:MAG TPA: efflux RND transporter periplasmic adaptor subunit [Candidatus Binatia bacterium]|nr:efflux RND transporter periplasmic adaptor subunit [Candidatus Binatia bacterium]